MDHSHIFIIVIELMGTIAFAISGAMVAVRCGMDLLGVIVLGVVTAVGGGMIRDIVLGNIPSALTDPIYVLTAVIVVRSCLSAGVLSPQNLIRRFSSTLCQTD